jgi:hypothetical protein
MAANSGARSRTPCCSSQRSERMNEPQPGRKGEIHLGELIEALAQLPWRDHAQAQAIAGCLGFGLAAHDLGRSERPTPAIYDRSRPPPLPRREVLAKPPSGFANPPPPRLDLPAQVLTSQPQPVTEPSPSSTAAAPSWIHGAYQRLDPTPGASPPRQTLFPGRTARGVFTAALATLRLGREIDVHALVGSVVRGHLPRRLPRLPAATLAAAASSCSTSATACCRGGKTCANWPQAGRGSARRRSRLRLRFRVSPCRRQPVADWRRGGDTLAVRSGSADPRRHRFRHSRPPSHRQRAALAGLR